MLSGMMLSSDHKYALALHCSMAGCKAPFGACKEPKWEVALCSRADWSAVLCRVAALRVAIVGMATANRHTVALAAGGAVYSWGCNAQGQLGYGTSDSASNATPRVVEAMKACSPHDS